MTQRECCIFNGLRNQIIQCQNELAECQLSTPPSLVVSTFSSGSGSGGPSAPIDTTGASLIVVNAVSSEGAALTLSDNKGNIFTALPVRTVSGVVERLFYVLAPVVGPNHIFTVAGAVFTYSMNIAAFDNVPVNSFDIDAGAANGGNIVSAGPLTPSQNNSLIVTGVGFTENLDGVLSVSGGFSLLNQTDYSGSSFGTGIAYKTATSIASHTASWQAYPTAIMQGLAASIAAFNWGPAPTYEQAAWEHWRFHALTPGNSTDPIVGSKGVGTLTPLSTYSRTGTTISTITSVPANPNGFNTGFVDRANRTVCAVVKRGASGANNYLITSGSMVAAGGVVTINPDFSPDWVQTISNGYASMHLPSNNVAVGDWFFVVSRTNAWHGGTGIFNHFTEMPETATPTANNIGIGNLYHPGQSLPLEIAEIIIFDSVLTPEQITAVYNRSRARMEQIGVIMPVPPAVIVVASTSKGTSASGGSTDPFDSSGSNLIVLNLAYYSVGTLGSVVDTLGNVYTPLDPHIDAVSGVVQQLWYCENPITGVAHQVQVTGSSIYAAIQVTAFYANRPASSFDQQTGVVGPGSSLMVGPVGQSTEKSLIIAGAGFSDATAMPITVNSGFTITGIVPYVFGSYFGGVMAYKVSDALALHGVNFNLNTPMTGISAGMATFKRTLS